jgi:hypothetical protein
VRADTSPLLFKISNFLVNPSSFKSHQPGTSSEASRYFFPAGGRCPNLD